MASTSDLADELEALSSIYGDAVTSSPSRVTVRLADHGAQPLRVPTASPASDVQLAFALPAQYPQQPAAVTVSCGSSADAQTTCCARIGQALTLEAAQLAPDCCLFQLIEVFNHLHAAELRAPLEPAHAEVKPKRAAPKVTTSPSATKKQPVAKAEAAAAKKAPMRTAADVVDRIRCVLRCWFALHSAAAGTPRCARTTWWWATTTASSASLKSRSTASTGWTISPRSRTRHAAAVPAGR